MKKNNLSYLAIILFTIFQTAGCKKEEIALGRSDPRLNGVWMMTARMNTIDSTFSRTVTKKSGDSTITTTSIIDTSFVRKKAIPSYPLQSITFLNDGSFQTTGKETEYYRAYRYFKIDQLEDREKIGFMVGGDFVQAAYQNFSIKNDSLFLLPGCEKECYLLFLKK